MSKTILVTGGAGFIGSHLCQALLEQGHHVICLDNFFLATANGDDTTQSDKTKNITHCLNHPNFSIEEHDIITPFQIKADQIYHLACPASPLHYQKHPISTIKTAVIGTLNVLECAKNQNIPVLIASTSEVYGDPLEHPQKETYNGNANPTGLRSCYDEGKRCSESLAINYHRKYNLPVKIARIFNTYGPNMVAHDGRVVSNFITQALEGQNITINGTGEQTRSFCYVRDMVDALIAFMNTPNTQTGPLNIGNPEEITIKDLAKKILELTNSTSNLNHEVAQEDDPKKRKPDITKAKELLKWQPSTSLQDGLEATINYFLQFTK